MMVLLPRGYGSFPAKSNLVLWSFLPSNWLPQHKTTNTIPRNDTWRDSWHRAIFVVFTGPEGKRKISPSCSPFLDRSWVPTLQIHLVGNRRDVRSWHFTAFPGLKMHKSLSISSSLRQYTWCLDTKTCLYIPVLENERAYHCLLMG